MLYENVVRNQIGLIYSGRPARRPKRAHEICYGNPGFEELVPNNSDASSPSVAVAESPSICVPQTPPMLPPQTQLPRPQHQDAAAGLGVRHGDVANARHRLLANVVRSVWAPCKAPKISENYRKLAETLFFWRLARRPQALKRFARVANRRDAHRGLRGVEAQAQECIGPSPCHLPIACTTRTQHIIICIHMHTNEYSMCINIYIYIHTPCCTTMSASPRRCSRIIVMPTTTKKLEIPE